MRDLSSTEAETKKQIILGAIQEVEPDLTEEAVVSAIEEAAGNLKGLDSMLRQLGQDADLFLGSTVATPVTQRLIVLLRELGAKNVSLARCTLCGSGAKLTHTLERYSGKRVCNRCYRRNYRVMRCSGCGEERSCPLVSAEGQPICATCAGKDPRKWEICGVCGDRYRVNARADDGSAICSRCYRKPEDVCDVCGETRTINTRRGGRNVCTRCYKSPKRECGGCGRVTHIVLRAKVGNPDLCQVCWKGPTVPCTMCGQEDVCSRYKGGSPLCPRCRLAVRLDETLIADDNKILEPLLPFKELVLSADKPQTCHNWLDLSPSIEILRRIARGKLELTHEALDRLPQVASLRHLRDLLVSSGALPWRDPYLARLERAVVDESARIDDPEDALTIKAYGSWRVLRRTRDRYENLGAGMGSVLYARQNLHWAAEFVCWLQGRGKSLASCSQGDVDLWLASGTTTHYIVQGFVSWAVGRGTMSAGTKVPVLRGQDFAGASMTAEKSVAMARWLLQDENLDLADRVVGALVTIYAQPLTRIARLKTGDVTVNVVSQDSGSQTGSNSEKVFLRIGRERVYMVEPLGRLLKELKERRWRRHQGILRTTCEDPGWLFPGFHPVWPQHPTYLQMRLNALGIEAGPARGSALMHLTTVLPEAIVADVTGIHPRTAEDWSRRVQGRWGGYVASKTGNFYDGAPEPGA